MYQWSFTACTSGPSLHAPVVLHCMHQWSFTGVLQLGTECLEHSDPLVVTAAPLGAPASTATTQGKRLLGMTPKHTHHQTLLATAMVTCHDRACSDVPRDKTTTTGNHESVREVHSPCCFNNQFSQPFPRSGQRCRDRW